MRKNLQQAYGAFKEWTPGTFGSLRVTVEEPENTKTLWSYDTPILCWDRGELVLNVSKYSRTTSSQQNSLRYLLSRSFFHWNEVDGLPRECSRAAVLEGWGPPFKTSETAY